MKRFLIALLAIAVFTALPAFAQKEFKVTNRIKLGGEGFWDYLTYDNEGQRLFITRGTHVMVVDTKTLKVAGDIPDLAAIHGVALAPEFNRGFITNGGNSTVTVFDLKTLAKLDSVKVGERPDAILFDPSSKHVFSFNARGQDSTVIDAATSKLLGSIAFGGRPEFAVSDGKGKLYLTMEEKSQIAVIDVNKQSVLNNWPTAPCEGPSAMAFDIEHHRLFAGCDKKIMAVIDSDSGKVITTVPIGDGVDAASFNPNTQEIFMSCGEGVLVIIHEDSPDKYTVRQNLPTAKGARTMALDAKNNIAYLVTAQREDKPVPPGQRPPLVPGSFELLVVRAE